MPINHQYKSENFSSREHAEIQFLVLHYTEVPLGSALGIFTNNYDYAVPDLDYYKGTDINVAEMCAKKVSTHYLNSEAGIVYNLVADEFAAYHAGKSFWSGNVDINKQSLGIEHENLGFKWSDKFPAARGVEVDGSDKVWCQFSEAQIIATIELCKELIRKHNLKPYNIVAHSDIAPDRKIDPGPLFPWQRLAAQGIGLWYDITKSTLKETNIPETPVLWMQQKLAEFGYKCEASGIADANTQQVIKAFQMHFRQNNIDGVIDLECMQIIENLCQRKLQYQLEKQLDAQNLDIKLKM